MADAGDLKSPLLTEVRVQLPPRPLETVKPKAVTVSYPAFYGVKSGVRNYLGLAKAGQRNIL